MVRSPMLLEALKQLLGIVAIAGVFLGPGAALLAAVGWSSSLRPGLAPAAALSLSLLLHAAVLAVTLTIGAPIVVNIVVAAVITAALIAVALVRSGLHMPRRRIDSAGWWTFAAAAFAAITGGIAGTYMRHDMLYHTAVALKLQMLDAPSFDNTQRFIDGGVNPAYALPVWHEAVAQAAALAPASAATIVWLLPFVLAPVYVLVLSGTARTLFDRPAAGAVAAWACLALEVLPMGPYLPMQAYGTIPGEVVFFGILPLVGATWVLSLEMIGRDARVTRAIAVLSTIVIGVLHANYLAYVIMFIVGYAIARAASGKLRSGEGKRLLLSGVGVAAAGVSVLALLLPALSRLSHFANGQDESAARIFDRFAPLLSGSAAAFHLAPGQLLYFGGLAIMALPCLLLTWFVRDSKVSWYLLGISVPILLVSQLSPLFDALLSFGSATVGIRMNRVLPLVLLLTLGVFVAAWLLTRRRTTRRVHPELIVGALIVAGVGAWLVHAWPIGGTSLYFVKAPFDYPGIVATVTLIAVVLLCLVLALRHLPRKGRVRSSLTATGTARLVHVSAVSTLALVLLTGALVAASLAGAKPFVETVHGDLINRPANADGVDQFTMWRPKVINAIRDLPTGSVVLADSRTSYDLMALAPLYVVADFKTWQADTPDNDTAERLAEVDGFFGADATDQERIDLIRRRHVDYVMTDNRSRSIAAWAEQHPELFTPDPELPRVIFRVIHHSGNDR